MIRKLSNLFNTQLKDKDNHYQKISNELVVSSTRTEDQIEILCETIRILNKTKPQIIEKRIEIRETSVVIEQKEEPIVKTDKYIKPIKNFGEIKPIPRNADLRHMRDRISQDSVRIAVNTETKETIISFGFENRYDYLYFKIDLNTRGRIVL